MDLIEARARRILSELKREYFREMEELQKAILISYTLRPVALSDLREKVVMHIDRASRMLEKIELVCEILGERENIENMRAKLKDVSSQALRRLSLIEERAQEPGRGLSEAL